MKSFSLKEYQLIIFVKLMFSGFESLLYLEITLSLQFHEEDNRRTYHKIKFELVTNSRRQLHKRRVTIGIVVTAKILFLPVFYGDILRSTDCRS